MQYLIEVLKCRFVVSFFGAIQTALVTMFEVHISTFIPCLILGIDSFALSVEFDVDLLKEHPTVAIVTVDLFQEIYPKQDFRLILTAVKSS